MVDSVHHYVPRWYLRRFADAKRQVRVYRPGTGFEPYTTSIRNVAAERGFYKADMTGGEDPNAIETLLSKYETFGSEAVQRIVGGAFPPSPQDRQDIAELLGLQVFRTPESRRQTEMNIDAFLKYATAGASRKQVEEMLLDAGLEASEQRVDEMVDLLSRPDDYEIRPSANEHLREMLHLSEDAAARLAARTWTLGIAREPVFITSDHPLVSYTQETHTGGWIGLGLDVRRDVLLSARSAPGSDVGQAGVRPARGSRHHGAPPSRTCQRSSSWVQLSLRVSEPRRRQD